MADILVMHGINLNMLGKRDPHHYGTATLDDINRQLVGLGTELGLTVETFHSNCEGGFVERIHRAHSDGTRGLAVNAAAWTHYSYGIGDALAILTMPIVEIHMSNVHARETFRHVSMIAPNATGSIAGFGVDSYLLGLRAIASLIRTGPAESRPAGV